MRLAELSPNGFRNLSPDPIFFGSGITLIAGNNAQGKTNLLEAVALVCGQRSFRRAKPSEMAADAERFSIRARLVREAHTEALEVEWSRLGGRCFARSGKPISFRDASALAPAVFLAPEHRELLVGSPAARRRFLDRLALASRPASGADLIRYERALASRNALLSRSGSARPAPGELEAWTEELVSAGTAVRFHRRRALAEWLEIFRELAREAGRNTGRFALNTWSKSLRKRSFGPPANDLPESSADGDTHSRVPTATTWSGAGGAGSFSGGPRLERSIGSSFWPSSRNGTRLPGRQGSGP